MKIAKRIIPVLGRKPYDWRLDQVFITSKSNYQAKTVQNVLQTEQTEKKNRPENSVI